MSSTAKAKRNPGGAAVLRAGVTDAITGAVMDELADKGYHGMSIDSVARAAGVGKSAIYRRWSSKEAMTAEVISNLIVFEGVEHDTGSLRGDLRQALGEMYDWLSDVQVRRIFADLLANSMRSPVLAQALALSIATPRRARGMKILDLAAERGELPDSVDREMVLDLLGAPVFWRMVARDDEHISPAYLDQLATLIANGIGPAAEG